MLVGYADRLFGIYSTLDEACAHDGALPPRAFSQVARFIDDMRLENPASEFLELAEGILIIMFRLQTALGNRSDNVDAIRCRSSLKKMCDEWLRACPLYRAIPANFAG